MSRHRQLTSHDDTQAARSGGIARGAICVLSLAMLSAISGCAPLRTLRDQIRYNAALDDTASCWRSHICAKRAWKQHRGLCADHPHSKDFGRGFRAGFCSVCDGDDGCVPVVPPRTYWNTRYQTPDGQAQIAAWFEGYPHGARAAEELGLGNFSRIQTSLPDYYRSNAMPTPMGQPSDWPMYNGPAPEALPLPPLQQSSTSDRRPLRQIRRTVTPESGESGRLGSSKLASGSPYWPRIERLPPPSHNVPPTDHIHGPLSKAIEVNRAAEVFHVPLNDVPLAGLNLMPICTGRVPGSTGNPLAATPPSLVSTEISVLGMVSPPVPATPR